MTIVWLLNVVTRTMDITTAPRGCYCIGDPVSLYFNTSQGAVAIRLKTERNNTMHVVDYSTIDQPPAMRTLGDYTVDLLSTSPLQARVRANFSSCLDGSIIYYGETSNREVEPPSDNSVSMQLCGKYHMWSMF